MYVYLAAPQILPFTFGNEPTNFGDSVGIQCIVAKGDLPVNITWMHNSEYISETIDIIIGRMSLKSSSLNIDYVTGEHRGIYKCIVTNIAGSTEYETELFVNG